jgi:4-amino-4-deoxy-L-arabinose transferase-like glycosyltransferase
MNKQKITIFAVILAVLAINLFFGLPRLAGYSSVDEPYWTYDRTPDFWRAIANKKWKNTKINDKPGVTTAAISGLGLPFIPNPLEYKSLRQEPKNTETLQDIKDINFALRLPIYLTTLAFLLIFFWLLKKLLGDTVALLSFIFIGLSPIILGVSLIINPDSLLWGFLPLSILSYLVYQKSASSGKEQKKYLIFCGIFLGLSLLTKYVANILYVYLLGLLFLEYIYNFHGTKTFFEYLKKALLNFAIIIAISGLTFFALFPATWKDPSMVLKGTILSVAFKSTWPIFATFLGLILADMLILKSKISSLAINFLAKYGSYLKKTIGSIMLLGIIFVFFNVLGGMKIFDFVAEMASPKGGQEYGLIDFLTIVSADLYALLFALTPLVFLSFCWAIFANTWKKESESKEATIVLYFSIFILLYYIASTANHVTATIRYQIVTFPLASIIAAIGLSQLMKIEKVKNRVKNYYVFSIAILISSVSLFLISPYFFNYSSVLLPQKYVLNLKDMGDGSFEAATYLNNLPNPQELVIWSDKGAVCETFLGKCNVGFNKGDTKDFNFDYFVVSTGRKSRSLKLHSAGYWEQNIDFQKLYSSEEPGIFKVNFGGREDNFVKISRSEDVLK